MSRSEDELRELAESLPGDGHEVLPADVADAGSVRQAVERFGELDVLVANAGIAHYSRFQELGIEKAEQMTRVNWLGTLYTVDAALPGMIERGRATGDRLLRLRLPRLPPGLRLRRDQGRAAAFSDALRHELADTGVSVTTVFPGEIKSRLHDHERDSMPAWYHADDAADPAELAKRVVEAVDSDKRSGDLPADRRAAARDARRLAAPVGRDPAAPARPLGRSSA